MKAKTSVYLEAEQAARLEDAAEATGRSKADLIREGIDLVLLRSPREPRTRPWPSFDSGDPEFAATADSIGDHRRIRPRGTAGSPYA